MLKSVVPYILPICDRIPQNTPANIYFNSIFSSHIKIFVVKPHKLPTLANSERIHTKIHENNILTTLTLQMTFLFTLTFPYKKSYFSGI